jgi:hypothetical protein
MINGNALARNDRWRPPKRSIYSSGMHSIGSKRSEDLFSKGRGGLRIDCVRLPADERKPI